MRHRIAAAADVAEGSGIAVDVGDRRIAVFRYRGELYALDETCPHRGGPLHEGPIEDGAVVCPWHLWKFDLATGCSPVNPLSRVRTYELTVDNDEIFVDVDE